MTRENSSRTLPSVPMTCCGFSSRASEQVDARRIAWPDVLLADQHLVGVVRGDDRGEDGHHDQGRHDDQTDHAGLAPAEAAEGEAPLARRLGEQVSRSADMPTICSAFSTGLRRLI